MPFSSPSQSPYRAPAEREPPRPPRPADLGRLVEVYETSGAAHAKEAALGFAGALAVVVIVVLVVTKSPLLIISLVIGVVVITGLIVGPEQLLRGPVTVAVHEQGLRFSRRRGEEEMRWDNVKHVFLDAEVVTQGLVGPEVAASAELTLVGYDGRRIVIPRGVKRFGELWDRIQRTVSRPLVSGARASLDDGETLYFGPVALSRDNIAVRGRAYSWGEIEETRATPEKIVLVRRGLTSASVTVALKDVPHPHVLLALLTELAKVNTL